MPFMDDDDNDIIEDCTHCGCYSDGGKCCDCGELHYAEDDDYLSDAYYDDDDNIIFGSAGVPEPIPEDDGSDENSD